MSEKETREPGGRPQAAVAVALDHPASAGTVAGWAAGEALRRTSTLHLVTVIDAHAATATPSSQASIDTRPDAQVRDAYDLLAATEAELRAAHPQLRIERSVLAGGVAHELRAIARASAVLVVGSRGRGRFAGLLLGSVGMRLAAFPPCPLVLVPRIQASTGPPRPTVVGVDEHEHVRVLHYALEHAERAGGGLRVVHAWTPYPAHSSAEFVSDTDILARQARRRAAAWLADVHAEQFQFHPDIEAVRGGPAEVLAAQSHTADLLVVGAHHHRVPLPGGTGSVLHHLIRESRCPMAVIPAR